MLQNSVTMTFTARAVFLLAATCGPFLAIACNDAGQSAGDASANGDAKLEIPVPGCLAQLFAACQRVGDCRSSSDPIPAPTSGCYENGVTFQSGGYPSCGPAASRRTSVYKSDGTLCYTLDITAGTLCESSSGTWSDATGTVIATHQEDLILGYRLTCSGGTTTTCRYSDSCSWGSGQVLIAQCTTGTCP